jgi:glycosyltransferase involved in cell wall biosynthesis
MLESHANIDFLDFPQRWDLVAYRHLRRYLRAQDADGIHAWGADVLAIVAAANLGLGRCWMGSAFTDLPLSHLIVGRLLSRGRRTCKVMLPEWKRLEDQRSRAWLEVDYCGYGATANLEDANRSKTRDHLCRLLQIPKDSKIVGFVGDLTRDNRLKDAIWAADLLKVVRDDVHLVLAGSGPHLPRLARFRDQVQIRDRVHFVLDPTRTDDVLWSLDCCWIPGESDRGLPTMMEATARGIPVIASATNAHQLVVQMLPTHHLFEIGHRAGLARLTLRLLENPQATQPRVAGDLASGQHSASVVAETYAKAYQRLVGGSSASEC